MTEQDFRSKMRELEEQLNDPRVPMEPLLVWTLIDEVATYDRAHLSGAGQRSA